MWPGSVRSPAPLNCSGGLHLRGERCRGLLIGGRKGREPASKGKERKGRDGGKGEGRKLYPKVEVSRNKHCVTVVLISRKEKFYDTMRDAILTCARKPT